MRHWLAGLVFGILLGWAAQGAVQGAEQPDQILGEIPVAAARGSTLTVPPTYGRLADVAVSSEVHHLYFENSQGTIRIVRIGPSGKVQRARNAIQMLSRDVYTVERKTIDPVDKSQY